MEYSNSSRRKLRNTVCDLFKIVPQSGGSFDPLDQNECGEEALQERSPRYNTHFSAQGGKTGGKKWVYVRNNKYHLSTHFIGSRAHFYLIGISRFFSQIHGCLQVNLAGRESQTTTEHRYYNGLIVAGGLKCSKSGSPTDLTTDFPTDFSSFLDFSIDTCNFKTKSRHLW